MSFDPDAEVRAAETHLRELAQHPAWRAYVADRARRMAAEEHGMWRPLQQLADEIEPKGERRARHRM